MQISDCILSHHLQDVYWLTGGPCSGKTTVAKLLCEKHGLTVFPDRFSEYQQAADSNLFPAIQYARPGTDWEWFFTRPMDEYVRWIEEVAANMLEFIVTDLLRYDLPRPVIVNQFTDPLATDSIAPKNRVATLFAGDEIIERELLHRDNHSMILDCIKANTRDPIAAERNVVRASIEVSNRRRDRATFGDCKVIVRDDETRPSDLITAVEAHFGLLA